MLLIFLGGVGRYWCVLVLTLPLIARLEYLYFGLDFVIFFGAFAIVVFGIGCGLILRNLLRRFFPKLLF